MAEDTFDVEELEVSFSDTISQAVIRDRVEDVVEEDLQFREAFMNYPAQDVSTNVVEIPVPEDDMGLPSLVGEGDEYPREQEHYGTEKLTFDKFGMEIAFTWESQEDSLINHVSSQVDRQGRKLQERLNEEAYEVLANNNHPTTAGDADEVFSYQDVVAGRNVLKQESYNPDLMIVDLEASADLLTDANFIHATDMGDEILRTGQIGQIANLDVIEADSRRIGGDDATPGAFIIDTDWYGYESTRTGITSEEYTEMRTETDVVRIKTRMGWISIYEDACVEVEG
jgi:hypothetical protein